MQMITFLEVHARGNGYTSVIVTGPINAFVFGQIGIVVDDDCRLITLRLITGEAHGGSRCGTYQAYRSGCRCDSCRAVKRRERAAIRAA